MSELAHTAFVSAFYIFGGTFPCASCFVTFISHLHTFFHLYLSNRKKDEESYDDEIVIVILIATDNDDDIIS